MNIRKERQVQPPVPPIDPLVEPNRARNHDTQRAKESGVYGQQQPHAVDAQGANRIADQIAKERVLVIGGFHQLPLGRIGRRQHKAAMQRQGQGI